MSAYLKEAALIRMAYERGIQAGGEAARMLRQPEDALLIRQAALDATRELLRDE